MNCPVCAKENAPNTNFCSGCGAALTDAPMPRIGFSAKINDPAFAKYIRQSNQWAAIFSSILAVAAVIGFYIAGRVSPEMSNPESLFIGLGIGGMFLVIALFQIMGKRMSKTRDGVVYDKTIKHKTRRSNTGSNDSYTMERYIVFSVHIRFDSGKLAVIRSENNRTKFDYFKVGDRVRRHGGLLSYEKYDKTGDEIIFCNACATLCDIRDETCFRCKCPLLK